MSVTRVRTGATAAKQESAGATESPRGDGGKSGSVGSSRVTVLDRARRLVVSVGEQRFSPIQFQSFVAGGLEMTLELEKGDDPAELAQAALGMMRDIQREEFRAALAVHRPWVDEAERAVKAGK